MVTKWPLIAVRNNAIQAVFELGEVALRAKEFVTEFIGDRGTVQLGCIDKASTRLLAAMPSTVSGRKWGRVTY
jgi:hypothetical protein